MGAVLASSASATTWIVLPDGSGEFPDIQSAVDGAESGDVIELGNGTFTGDGNRDVQIHDTSLTIRSQSGDPEACVLDCEASAADPHRAFQIENAPCVFEGFTVRRGEAPGTTYRAGGAIYGLQSDLHVLRCRFLDNHAQVGGAVTTLASQVAFEDCLFSRNSAEVNNGAGGAIVLDGNSEIVRCTFVENECGLGSAIAVSPGGVVRIDQCTLVGNLGDAIVAVGSPPEGADALVSRTIVAFGQGRPFLCYFDGGRGFFSCSDLFGNSAGDWVDCLAEQAGEEGNLSADPLFCDPDAGDFQLFSASPCAPLNNPTCGRIGAWDVGCGSVPVEETSWGRLKDVFRPD